MKRLLPSTDFRILAIVLSVLSAAVACVAPVELERAQQAEKDYDACREDHPNDSSLCAHERADANRRWSEYEEEVDGRRQKEDDGRL
jgi:hypothetical protein